MQLYAGFELLEFNPRSTALMQLYAGFELLEFNPRSTALMQLEVGLLQLIQAHKFELLGLLGLFYGF
jgi:hypothetical protein